MSQQGDTSMTIHLSSTLKSPCQTIFCDLRLRRRDIVGASMNDIVAVACVAVCPDSLSLRDASTLRLASRSEALAPGKHLLVTLT